MADDQEKTFEERLGSIEKELRYIRRNTAGIYNRTGFTEANVRDILGKKFPEPKRRPGLYVLVGMTLAGTLCCGPCTPAADYLAHEYVSRKSLDIHVQNVLGEKEPEMFYEINGRRVYVEIDGMPVEVCFK